MSYGANFLLSGHGAQRARAAACQSSPTLKHGGRVMWGWALVTGHREAIIGLINLSLSLVLAESTRIDTLIVPGQGTLEVC